MTEQEWLAATDPQKMLDSLRGKASERKLRLFAAACCRRLWHLMGERTTTRAVETAEDFADGAVGEWKLRGLRSELAPRIRHGGDWVADQFLHDLLDRYAGRAAHQGLSSILWFRYPFASEGLRHTEAYQAAGERDAERERLIGLLSCVFGNPLRPLTADPAWLTSAVLALAARMYETRDFTPMPVLADALQEAGCENADILSHCRGPGPHARGCWVVDLVLGKG